MHKPKTTLIHFDKYEKKSDSRGARWRLVEQVEPREHPHHLRDPRGLVKFVPRFTRAAGPKSRQRSRRAGRMK